MDAQAAEENRPALRHGAESASSAERYQVMVHVTAETLAADADDRCELECGQRLAADTARRIACDGKVIRITEDSDGNPLDIGRKSRAVPPAMQRALRSRDRGFHFTRPDGCAIAEHPRLPALDIGDDALDSIRNEGGQSIDAAGWIIPRDRLDCGIAIDGLLWLREARAVRG